MKAAQAQLMTFQQGNKNNLVRLSSSAVVVGMAAAAGEPPGNSVVVAVTGDDQLAAGPPGAGNDDAIAQSEAQSLTSSFASLFSIANFQFEGSFEKLVIPLAGVTLLSAFLLVLIVNYFLHMRRNGFFKRHRVNRSLANRLDGDSQKASLEDRERLMSGANKATTPASNNNTGDLLDTTPDVTSNFDDLPIDQQLSFDLPPLPSPQLEYRPFFPHPTLAHQQLQQSITFQGQHRLSHPQETVPKMAVIVEAAQLQLQQQQQSESGTPVSPNGGAQTSSPKSSERRTGILSAAKLPSMSSIRSHSNNNSFNNRGSSERILSVQESFDSAYEVRLYDELAIDSLANRALSKRAPLLKGESLTDDAYALSTPLGGKKVPQSLMIAPDSSSGPYFSRQPSVGGDLSPVQEQPTHDEHPHQQKHPHFSTDVDTQEQLRNNGKLQPQTPTSPTSPPKQKSLLSLFKEKRVTLLEHVRATTSPTKSEHAPVAPQDAKAGAGLTMAVRPTDLLHQGTPRHGASGSALSMGGQGAVPQSASTGQMQSKAMMAPMSQMPPSYGRGPPGRGRARGGGVSTVSGPINANMLMRMGGRGGD